MRGGGKTTRLKRGVTGGALASMTEMRSYLEVIGRCLCARFDEPLTNQIAGWHPRKSTVLEASIAFRIFSVHCHLIAHEPQIALQLTTRVSLSIAVSGTFRPPQIPPVFRPRHTRRPRQGGRAPSDSSWSEERAPHFSASWSRVLHHLAQNPLGRCW